MKLARISVALLMFSIAGAVGAQATYTYSGRSFDTFDNTNTLPGAGSNPYSSANFISGSFTVSSVLIDGAYNFSALALQTTNPVSFSMTFSDGFLSYAASFANGSSNPSLNGWPAAFSIDVLGGSIVGWGLIIGTPPSGNPGGSGHAFSSSGGTLANFINPPGDFGGVVLGNGFATGGTSQFGSWISPVAAIPEPEIYAMLGVGLGVIGWIGRKKKLKERTTA